MVHLKMPNNDKKMPKDEAIEQVIEPTEQVENTESKPKDKAKAILDDTLSLRCEGCGKYFDIPTKEYNERVAELISKSKDDKNKLLTVKCEECSKKSADK